MTMIGPHQVHLLACNGSHNFSFYENCGKQKLTDNMPPVKFILPPFSLFVGHGSLHHSGTCFNVGIFL